MTSRSAHYTLDGYQYQFDKSILAILSTSSDVTLEGIEDIDAPDKLIQCKYHATQAYSRSKIRKPILAFLEHFATEPSGGSKYILHAYFSDLSVEPKIDVPELLAILGKSRVTLALTDTELAAFLSQRFEFSVGEEINVQQGRVRNMLRSSLGCSDSECTLYYYNNALVEVFRLSRQAAAQDRTTNRSRFLNAINHKTVLFAEWLAALAGRKKFIEYVKEQLLFLHALSPSKHKVVVLSNEMLSCPPSQFVAFCRDILDGWYKMRTAKHDAKPPVLICDCPLDKVRSLKAALLVDPPIPFNDGHEHIAFSATLFDEPPMTRRRAVGTKTSDIIDYSSYLLKVAGSETYFTNAPKLREPDTFISTTLSGDVPLYAQPCPRTFHLSPASNLETLRAILL